MKKIVFLIAGCLLLNGCIPIILGAGVLTGYALSGDSASGNVNENYREVWDACLEYLEETEAEITMANESKGLIRAELSNFNLTIKINTITSKNQHLEVSARKYLLPKPQFAQEIYLGIMQDI